MNDHPNDPFDELMRRSLSEEAGRIEPEDGLHEIQARVRAQRKPVSRRPWALTAGAAVIGAAAAVGAFAVLNDTTKTSQEPSIAGGPDTTSSASAEPSTLPSTLPASPKPTPAATPPPASNSSSTLPTEPKARGVVETDLRVPKAVPVYWLGQRVGVKQGQEFRLYRTFNQVSGKPALEALRTMTSPKAANDADYESPWAGASVSSVRYTDDLIMVDFDRLPTEKLKPAVADMAVQQLVYTVQGALQRTAPVQVTQQGRATPELFGVLDTKTPLSRAQTIDVQAFVWITSPENNQTVKQPITVAGVAAAYEAQVDWRATNVKTKQTIANYTMTKEGQKFSPFTFSTKLDPGEWLLEVYLTSPEDGRITDTDSKTVYVK